MVREVLIRSLDQAGAHGDFHLFLAMAPAEWKLNKQPTVARYQRLCVPQGSAVGGIWSRFFHPFDSQVFLGQVRSTPILISFVGGPLACLAEPMGQRHVVGGGLAVV